MFPGNQKVKSRRKSLWAQEIRERCSAEFTSAEKKARKSSKTRTQKIKEMEKLLEKVPDAIISCYKGGSHSMCDKYSLVCSKKKRWDKSGLPSVMQRKMNMTRLDQKKTKHHILKRLGSAAVEKTYLNTNTNKNESFNRRLGKNMAKNVTHGSCTASGRAHSAALQANEGFTVSALECHKVFNHTVSNQVKKRMEMVDRKRMYIQCYRRKTINKMRRVQHRKQMIRVYEKVGACKINQPYKKGIAN